MPFDQLAMTLVSSGILNFAIDCYFLLLSIPEEFYQMEGQLVEEKLWKKKSADIEPPRRKPRP